MEFVVRLKKAIKKCDLAVLEQRHKNYYGE